MNPAASKSFLLLIACGGLFFGALFFYVGWRLWNNGRELRRAGITADATITQKFRKAEDKSWGGLENYYLHVRFTDAAGRAQETEVKVQSKLWRQLREGNTTPITYLPGRIETAQAGPRWGWQLRGVLGIAIMIYGALAMIVFPLGAVYGLFKNGF